MLKAGSGYSKKYAEKRKQKQVKIAMYLDDPTEAHIYDTWQKEKNKKQLFLKLYLEYLAKKPDL